MNEEELNEWDKVRYILDASVETLEKNYEKSILLMRKGVEENLESENVIDSKKLLSALYSIILIVENSLKNDFGFQIKEENKSNISEEICSFCGNSRSEVKILVAGSRGFICDLCVTNIFNNLKNSSNQIT